MLVETAPPEPEWSSRGYLALSTLVLLAGRPKVGKSTLVFALIASAIRGDAFLGLAAKARGVLLLTEERRDTLAEKARVLGLMDADVPVYALSRHEAQATTWPEVVRDAMSFCREHELDVLIVDTLDRGSDVLSVHSEQRVRTSSGRTFDARTVAVRGGSQAR